MWGAPRAAALALLVGLALAVADDEALAARARDLRALSFGFGRPVSAGVAAEDAKVDLLDDIDDFELILAQPGAAGDPAVLLEEEASTRGAGDFSHGRLPDIPGVSIPAQSIVKAVVKCWAYAVANHQTELKSKASDAVAANADRIFPDLTSGVTRDQMAQIRGSLSKVADLLNFGSGVDRLPDIMGVPGLTAPGQAALKQMLVHVYTDKRKEEAFPKGSLKPGIFGHFPIRVLKPKPAKPKADAAEAPPAAEGPSMPLPAPETDDPTTSTAPKPNSTAQLDSNGTTGNAKPGKMYEQLGRLNLTRKIYDQMHQGVDNRTSVREMGDHLVARMVLSKGGLSAKAQRCETICGVPDEVDSRASDAAVASFLERYWREARLGALNTALRKMPHLAKLHAASDKDALA